MKGLAAFPTLMVFLALCVRQAPADYFLLKPGSKRVTCVNTCVTAGAETTEVKIVEIVWVIRVCWIWGSAG